LKTMEDDMMYKAESDSTITYREIQKAIGFLFILSERELKKKIIFYLFLFHHFFKVFTQSKIFLF
jgi:hypothetical protein